MGKLDPNLLILLLAGAGGIWFYLRGGGKEMLQGLTTGGGTAAVATDEDVDPDPKAVEEETQAPEPEESDAEEQWDDGKGNTYIIYVDGYMGINGQRRYAPDAPDWNRYYNMKKYNYRYRGCGGRYRNNSWCKNKERFCTGAWRNTPWCRGFKRGNGHHYDPRPPVKPPRTPPRGGGNDWPGGGHDGPPTTQCPLSIQKNGKTYRFTRDPMPDVMPAIFPPPYVKQGNCVYKLDNNNGNGQDGRDGWDGDRGGHSSGGLLGMFGFYTYNRIGNV